MLTIDGSHGEGGGQILRTSLALSILTQKPVRITNIRVGRKSPGLKPQHLIGTHAVAQLSQGKLEGDHLGSTAVAFHPGPAIAGDYTFDVATVAASAGATGLIYQTILWPLGYAAHPSRVILKGGTHVAWSPPADYLQEVFLPAVIPMGVRSSIETGRYGFYPIGGGELRVAVSPFPVPLKPLRVKERGELVRLKIISGVANLPLSIGQRQTDQAVKRLRNTGFTPEGESQTVPASGKGTYCFILAEFKNIRVGFSALGEWGKRAEQVADEAVENFLRYWERPGALDPHLSDQVILPMALAEGESVIFVSEVTEHLRTNIWVVEQFLPVTFRIEENPDGAGGYIRVAGCAHRIPLSA